MVVEERRVVETPTSPSFCSIDPIVAVQAVNGLGHLGRGTANGGMTEAVRREVALRDFAWLDSESLRNISAM